MLSCEMAKWRVVKWWNSPPHLLDEGGNLLVLLPLLGGGQRLGGEVRGHLGGDVGAGARAGASAGAVNNLEKFFHGLGELGALDGREGLEEVGEVGGEGVRGGHRLTLPRAVPLPHPVQPLQRELFY